MAEERTLGLARAQDLTTDEEPSKEELQRRLGVARDSITNTVSEIKETVANQVQAVKDTLDWREQFKKRPVAWSAAAMGAGFATGYCIASYVKGEDSEYDSAIDRYGEESRYYATQGIASGAATAAPLYAKHGNGTHDTGPNFFKKITNTQAFEKVKNEAGNIGDAFVQELSNTAKTVVLPALITSLRNFIGDYLPNAEKRPEQRSPNYQPSLERNPS
ncbi:MAG TPA: hypothetical protein VKB05_12975 [Pyrinomonadaceae bacterium]|nr:hypothetical protein [Pyrinomonadaceae bacterium]